MNIISKLRHIKDKYNLFVDENYNIGFIDNFFPETLLREQKLPRIKWMKHSYRDRFFADPFILDFNDSTITILVEECLFNEHVGRISQLLVDRRTKELIDRRVLLELDTHLSYPFIKSIGDGVYVFPENSQSGRLDCYKLSDSYNFSETKLTHILTLIKEPLVDATIFINDDLYYIMATKSPNTQSDLYLFQADELLGEYTLCGCVATGLRARPAGDVFTVNESLFRPAQNCEKRYGANIDIVEIHINDGKYAEERKFSIYPDSFKYHLGLHTLNFKDGLCVIDGYGYLYPILGRLREYLYTATTIVKKIFRITQH